MKEINRSIVDNARYIVKYFNERQKEVSNLKLQKLLYFLEAIYLFENVEEMELFNESFTAWDFGPVNNIIYNLYKKFGSSPIELENIDEIDIPRENEEYISILYYLFGEYTGSDLVTISHLSGSPWDKICRKYDGNIPHDEVIDKNETREWFKTIVKKEKN